MRKVGAFEWRVKPGGTAGFTISCPSSCFVGIGFFVFLEVAYMMLLVKRWRIFAPDIQSSATMLNKKIYLERGRLT